jgi:hypothetical protein
MTVVHQHNDDLPTHLPNRKLGKMNSNVAQPSIQIHNHIPGSGVQMAYGESPQFAGAGQGGSPHGPHLSPNQTVTTPQPTNPPPVPAPAHRKATLEFPSARYTRIRSFLAKLEAEDADRDYACYEAAFIDCLGASSICDLLATIRESAAEIGNSKALGSTLLKVLRQEVKERNDLGNIQIPPLAVATVICQNLESAALACEDALQIRFSPDANTSDALGSGPNPFRNGYD